MVETLATRSALARSSPPVDRVLGQAVGRVDDDAARLDVDVDQELVGHRQEALDLAVVDDQAILVRPGVDARDDAPVAPVRQLDLAADQVGQQDLPLVELDRVAADLDRTAAQRVGGVAVADAGDLHQICPLDRARLLHRIGAPADPDLLGGVERGRLRVVQVHAELAAHPVRTRDDPYLDAIHTGHRSYSRISTRVRLPVRGAAALTIVRMARAVLPPRPMILPRSSSPT